MSGGTFSGTFSLISLDTEKERLEANTERLQGLIKKIDERMSKKKEIGFESVVVGIIGVLTAILQIFIPKEEVSSAEDAQGVQRSSNYCGNCCCEKD